MLEKKKEKKNDFVYAHCFEEYQTTFFPSRMHKMFFEGDLGSSAS